jgi:hypothetical protein
MLALMLLNGWLLSMVRPDLGLGNEAPNLYMMGGNLSKVFLSTLGVFAIQYWFSLRVKNYMIPIFIGGFAVMIFTFANMMGWKKCIYIPYAYTSIVERYVGGMKKMDTIGGLPHFLWWGVAGFFVIGIAAVVDAVYKRVKA